jgi:hypothetical protein
MRLSLNERRTRGPVQSCVQEIGAIDGYPMRLPRVKASVLPAVSAPILRVLCEGWDSQISPFDLPRKADLFLRKPGFLLAYGSWPYHPGLSKARPPTQHSSAPVPSPYVGPSTFRLVFPARPQPLLLSGLNSGGCAEDGRCNGGRQPCTMSKVDP